MVGIELILIASLFVAVSNLCMRKSVEAGGTTKAFLVLQLTVVALVAVLLGPMRTGDLHWSYPMAMLGAASGVVLAVMMRAIGRAVETGPSGLTFATLNASSVMPQILMVLLFGSAFGYTYTWLNAFGSLLVVVGLFWVGMQGGDLERKKGWFFYAILAFALHTVFLAIMQWRALFLNFTGATGLFFHMSQADADSQWFMPSAFFSAAALQAAWFFTTEKRAPLQKETLYGVLGGIANGVGTYFMIRSTELAKSWENAVIFPLFSVATILFCNLWGNRLYKEKIYWKANFLCMGGILVGMVQWKALFS